MIATHFYCHRTIVIDTNKNEDAFGFKTLIYDPD